MGYITIVSDEKPVAKKKVKKTTKKVAAKNKKAKKAKKAKKKVVEIVDKYVIPETGEDRDVTPKAWNFRTGDMEVAQVVPKSEIPIIVADDDPEDIEFVDPEEEALEAMPIKKIKTKKKKKATKKAAKKKTKKKVLKAKKRKVKSLEPVGEKRLPKTAMDAAIELDSRGKPIGEGGSDHLKHLIDLEDSHEDVGFADDEQALKRYNNRTDMG